MQVLGQVPTRVVPARISVALWVREDLGKTALATFRQRADHVDGRVHREIQIATSRQATVCTPAALHDDVPAGGCEFSEPNASVLWLSCHVRLP